MILFPEAENVKSDLHFMKNELRIAIDKIQDCQKHLENCGCKNYLKTWDTKHHSSCPYCVGGEQK